jgi:hypothetical protein
MRAFCLADDALVVRCGRPPFDNPKPLHERCDEHPEGVFGFSVQSAPGVPLDQLAAWCRNKTIGFTTVGAIRVLGYDVKVTRGAGFHATVEVPRDWAPTRAEQLARIFREAINPSPRKS